MKKRRQVASRGAVAGAVLVAVAGCTSLESRVSKAYKVEPVFNVNGAGRSSQGYYTLGQYYEGSQDWGKAIEAYRKAIAVDASNIEAFGALGVALARSGRYADAETTLRQAVALAPDRTHVRNNLGYVLLLAGKPREAIYELTAVVERDGKNAIAQGNLQTAIARAGTAAEVGAIDERLVTPVAARSSRAPPTAAFGQSKVDTVVRPSPSATLVVAQSAFRVGYAPTVAALDQRAESADPGTSGVGYRAATMSTPPALTAAAGPLHTSRLEVSNGNGASGMAARVGRWLAAKGLPADRLTNRQPFVQRQTVILYRQGHEENALLVARSLPTVARTEITSTLDRRSDVQVVIGHDWLRRAACLDSNRCPGTGEALALALPH